MPAGLAKLAWTIFVWVAIINLFFDMFSLDQVQGFLVAIGDGIGRGMDEATS